MANAYRVIPAGEIEGNLIDKINREWALISARDGDRINTMTASWGTFGTLWGRPVATVFIRPQRYTFGLAEKAGFLTLSFFGDGYREALRYCGSHSGRDGDKFAAAGLTPVLEDGIVYPAEARLVLVLKKLYADDIREENMTDPAPMYTYEARDFHRFYVCEIVEARVFA